jgi:DNA adenine methylase
LRDVELCCQRWDEDDDIVEGSFVYYDPPYVPVSSTANFTAYTQDGFTPTDQLRLVERAALLKSRGVHVLLSNSASEATLALYRQHGFQVAVVQVRRNINSKASKRGAVGEMLAW